MNPASTCGQGIAARAPLVHAIARVLASVAGNLELHLGSLDPDDPAARPEHDAYRDLVARHRRLTDELFALAERMIGYRDLPMAPHDPEALSRPAVMEAFRELARREEALLGQLEQALAGDRGVLTELDGT